MKPHLIADVPVKALIIKNHQTLITKHRRWELPGGRMHVGETPEETLHREVKEELGIEVAVLGLVDVFVRSDSDPAHLLVVYRCKLTDDAPFQTDKKEIQDLRWISKDDDLSSIDFYPGYREMLAKFFQNRL